MSTLHTETLSYSVGGSEMQSYLSYDKNVSDPRPGILVVHEWWGLDDYIKRRARMLAELGYVALAVDMYGGGRTADTPEQAGAMMNQVLGDMKAGTARLQAGFDQLCRLPQTDAGKTASIGYCFGGAVSLHAARVGMPLSCVVSFHGSLGSFHKPAAGGVKARVLVCHGSADSLIPEADIAGFKQEMDDAGADYQFISYDGAMHGFSNPRATENGEKYGLPLAYDADVDQRSWQAMRDFFAATFA